MFAVCLNAKGRLIDHERFEDFKFADTRDRLQEHIERLKPDVIVVGGFTPSTHRLFADLQVVKNQINEARAAASNGHANADEDEPKTAEIEVIYVYDDVARLYQHSRRALADYSEISPVARYCIGLARYAQSPLCEYASLGEDLTAITYDTHQKLVRYYMPIWKRFSS